jgi:trimeric autotransporter adhesin
MPSIWRKTNGSWVKLKTVYRKTGGSWQSVKRVWRKSEGTWRLVFLQSLTPSIAQQVTVSMTTGTTQLKTLVGRLYRWSDATSVSYQFTKGTNGISFSNISGASGTSTNPASGSSNTSDQYTLAQADVTANTTNYYQYVSRASNSTFGTEQTSASDYITLEAPRDLTLDTTATSTSITVSWTNDTYSGRYEYQYKLTTDATWSTAAFLAPGTTTTSFTRSSLTNSTSYDFRVRGWTGTSNNYGYYGNWATATKSTSGPQAPNAPTGVQAASGTVDKDSFFLEWTASTVDSTHDAATSYDFGINSSAGSPPSTLITTGNPGVGQYRNKLLADTNRYELISSLSANTTYYAYVRAKNSGGSSAWSASSSITTATLKPPNNITGLAKDTSIDSQTSLKFTWTAPTVDSTHTDATSYVYSYGTTDAAPTNSGDYETTGGGSGTEITLTGLSANTDYYIFIKAKNEDGLSSSWVRGTGKTKAASNPPGTPTGVSLGNPSQSGLRFTWSAGTGGTPTSYVIALSTTTTEPTVENLFDYDDYYYDTTVTTTNFTFGVLDPNKTYYAWVKARNADGTSTSVRRNATTAAAPTVGAPTWTSATNFQRTSTQIRWGWGNTGTLSPTTGTYTAMTRSTMFWQFYTTATTGTITASGSKDYTTTNDTRTTVNSVNFPYLLTSGSSSPDITYSTSSRFVRVQASAYDYDGKSWDSAWTARI